MNSTFFHAYPFPFFSLFFFSGSLVFFTHSVTHILAHFFVLSSQQCTIPLLLTACSRLSCKKRRTLFVPLDICHIHIDLDLDLKDLVLIRCCTKVIGIEKGMLPRLQEFDIRLRKYPASTAYLSRPPRSRDAVISLMITAAGRRRTNHLKSVPSQALCRPLVSPDLPTPSKTTRDNQCLPFAKVNQRERT